MILSIFFYFPLPCTFGQNSNFNVLSHGGEGESFAQSFYIVPDVSFYYPLPRIFGQNFNMKIFFR